MRSDADVSGFVLAGGRSTRLGVDKVLLPWSDGNSGSLVEHAIARLRLVCDVVRVCATRDDLAAFGPPIPDAVPGAGPLGGIVAALEASEAEWDLFLAVDLPFVPAEFLGALAERARTGGALAVVPSIAGRLQPTCAAYHRSLADGLRGALTVGNYKLMEAVGSSVRGQDAAIDAWEVGEMVLAGVDGAASGWFLNINTMEDWEQAQRLLAAGQRSATRN